MRISENYPFNLIDELFDIAAFPSDLLPSVEYALNLFLNEREVKAIHMRYKYEMTYEEMGKEFGVTRERVRQIEMRAITKLKRSSSIKWISLGVSGMIAKAKQEATEQKLNTAIENIVQISSDLREITKGELFLKQIDEYENTVNLDAQLDILDLSVRSYNCLFRADKTTLRDLTNTTLEELREVRNLGKKSYDEVIRYVHSKGLTFKGEIAVEG